MRLSFHGAAGEVTGSCAEVETGRVRFLVDCGMFQGGRMAAGKNLRALAFSLRDLDFVLLTHAHLDHTGLIPRLVALGYRGPIYATKATIDLLEVLLLDSAHIQEKECEWANRRSRKRNPRSLSNRAPLYTVEQARSCLAQLRPVDYDIGFSPVSGIRLCFREAGHILGSAFIEIDLETARGERRVVFSGDLGQDSRPVLRDPAHIKRADYMVIESTYGNRLHRDIAETELELAQVLEDTLERRNGNVIIPAFAVGRTQELIFVLSKLVRDELVRPIEIVVDSPMASAVTEMTLHHDHLWDGQTRELRSWVMNHPERVRWRFVQDVQESIALNDVRSGQVILSASGMCEAGRIKHHLQHNLPRSECSVVICGFQAAGTLGRRLVDGARWVTLFGARVPVRASIHTIGGLSAHADQAGLLAWLSGISTPPRTTFIVHGEHTASTTFADAVEHALGWRSVIVPEPGSTHQLD